MESLWAKAYKMIQDDGNHSQVLDKFEAYLQKGGDDGREEISDSSQGVHRLKQIQKLAEKKLEELPENRTSFSIGGKRIILRESVQKAIRTITQFKALISGAVSAEPHAALAWACILGVLPILESIFQQDEAAADGLGKIVFLLVPYQGIQDTILSRHCGDGRQTENTRQVTANIEIKLVGIYAKVYIYQIQFMLQYGRSKWRRNLGGIFKPEDWKQKWNEIDSARQLVDQSIQDRVSAKTLDTWEALRNIEAESTETLELVHDIKARGREIQNEQKSTKELHGLAGTGKSTVALTVADALKHARPFTKGIDAPVRSFLGASFFFKQGDASRNHIQAFFPTISRCLAEVFPDFKTLVAQAVEQNSAIGSKAPQHQLETLIAKPLSALDEQSLVPLRFIIVIDALDECLVRSEAVSLVAMLVGQLKDLRHVQLRFLITSRSEKHILGSFEQLPQGLHRSLLLDKIQVFEGGDDTKDDIMFYLTYTLAQLANSHGVPEDCITKSTIKELRNKADGLFIYAATACRFLDAKDFDDEEARQERLDLILESPPGSDESGDNDSDIDDWEAESPQNKIDDIYHKVLSFPDRENMSPRTKQRTYNDLCVTLGFLVVLFKPTTIPALKKFLPSLAKSLDRLLKKLHAIVSLPRNESTPLELVHQSFRDFILSKKRSKKLNFQVQESKMHKEAFIRCLDILSSELHEDICGLRWPGILQSDVSQDRVTEKVQQHLRYACRYWVDHLSKLDERDRWSVGLIDGGNVHRFLENHFLHWLETMILIEETASTVPLLNTLQFLVQHSECPELSASITYFKQFILSNILVIDQRPLQIYVSATTFNLRDSKARSLFEAHTPCWISQLLKVDGQWTSEICDLVGHTEKITCAAFSPAYDLILTISLDRTARLWDSITGTQRSIFEKTDPDAYTCGAFSPDGSSIGLGTHSGRFEVKKLLDERTIQLGSHKKGVENVDFSPKTSDIFASTSKDGDLRIWNVDERCAKHIVCICDPYGTDKPPSSEDLDPMRLLCQFTNDGRFLIVAGTSVGMTMWNVDSGECIKVFRGADTTFVMDLKISPDGNSAIMLQTPLIRRHESGYEIHSETTDDPDAVVRFNTVNNDMGSRTVTIINLATEEIEFYSDENENIQWISIMTQNANHILVGRHDTIELLDTKALSKVILFKIPYPEKYFAQSWDSRIVATRVDTYLSLWNMPSDAAGHGLREADVQCINSMELSPDNSLVRISRLGQESCEIYDSSGSRLALPIDAVESICFSHDGKYTVLGLSSGVCQLWNNTMTSQILPFKQWQKIIFSPCGKCIAFVSTTGKIEVVDSTTLELTIVCETASDLDVGDIELSPDGRTIGISYTDFVIGNTSIELWTVMSTERVWRKSSPKRVDCSSFKFSPDSRFFAFCWGGRELVDPGLWTIMDLSTFEERMAEYTPLLVFHPKSHVFAMLNFTEDGDWYIEVRETSSLSLVREIEICVEEAVWMAFTPSGRLVLSEGTDDDWSESTVWMWDIEKGSEVGSYTVDGMIDTFWISEDGCLNSSKGRLPLPSSCLDQEDKDIDRITQDDRALLYLGRDWIYRGLEKIMRLPPAFASSKSVLNGNTLAIAYRDRDLRVMKFNLDKMPV
ncbi:NACHT WD40 domain-containing protein [Fusarium mexicanum]|uniref:NACHT WD40 domain-containing protein n=1 Tax=Fusarium mexicanum TaxID=751941 RepID=A0A8H5JIS6_9HYPO|nr:NACHT WD40 domain-containing protein [Fusarium mexicanum]